MQRIWHSSLGRNWLITLSFKQFTQKLSRQVWIFQLTLLTESWNTGSTISSYSPAVVSQLLFPGRNVPRFLVYFLVMHKYPKKKNEGSSRHWTSLWGRTKVPAVLKWEMHVKTHCNPTSLHMSSDLWRTKASTTWKNRLQRAGSPISQEIIKEKLNGNVRNKKNISAANISDIWSNVLWSYTHSAVLFQNILLVIIYHLLNLPNLSQRN